MKSFKIFLLILCVGFGLGACKDFLNPNQDNYSGYDRLLNDPAFAQGLVIRGYTDIPSFYSFDDVATDDAVTNDQSNAYLRMATGEWSAITDATTVWSSAYATIVNMNYFLSIVNKVQWSWQDTIRNRLFRQRFTGEALTFRAYYYLRLLQHNGGIATDGRLLGVPLVNSFLTIKDNLKLPRATFQETVNQISADLDTAVRILPYRYFDIANATSKHDLAWNKVNGAGTTKNLLDGRVATALKARLSLLASSPAFNGGTNYDLIQADTAAHIAGRMIVNNGGLAAFPADNNFWNTDADVTNTDILWRNDYGANNTLEAANYPPSVFGNGRINPTQNLVDAFPMKNGYPLTNPLSLYNPQKPYLNRDSRLKMNILTDSTSLRSTIIRTKSDAATNDGLNKLALYSTRTGYYMLKLLRTDINMNPTATGTARHFYTHIRWTEIFLIYAEAANEKYGPDGNTGFGFTARQVIAAIRKRAGITQPDAYLATITTTAAMRDLIRNERRLELCFEGFRFWDIRRWNLLSTMTESAKGINVSGTPANYGGATFPIVENRVYQPYMIYGPIPYLDTKMYPGLLQNRGW